MRAGHDGEEDVAGLGDDGGVLRQLLAVLQALDRLVHTVEDPLQQV